MLLYPIVIVIIFTQISLKGSRVLVTLFAIELGAGTFIVGILIALYALFPIFVAIYAGKISDRFGFHYSMSLGSLGLGIGLVLPYLLPSLPTLYFSTALIGFSYIFYQVSMQNLIGSLGAADQRTKNFSVLSLGTAVSGLLGPTFTGFSIDHAGYVRTYLYLSIIAVLAGVAIFLLSRTIPLKAREPQEKPDKGIKDLMKNAPLRRVLIMSSAVMTGVHLFSFYFPIYGHSIGFSASRIGVILGLYAAATFVARSILPLAVKKYNEENVLTFSLLLAGVTFVCFPFFQNVFILTLISFILGLGLGCGQPLTIALTYNRSPQGRSGETLGLRITTNKIIQLTVPLVFGSIGSVFGFFPVFWSNALLLVCGGCANIEKIKGNAFAER
jgi:predicted MFS family arabinose efflux permease